MRINMLNSSTRLPVFALTMGALKPKASETKEEPEAKPEAEGTEAERKMADTMGSDNPRRATLNKMIAVLDADDELTAVAQDTAEANAKVKRAAFTFFLRLISDFTEHEELAQALPVPGSKDGNNPDKYKIDGERREGSFYNDLHDGWKVGRQIAFRIRQYELAMDNDTRPSAEKQWQDMAVSEPERLSKLHTNELERQRYSRRKLYQAAACLFQLNSINEYLGDKVLVQYPETIEEAEQDKLLVEPFTVRDGTTIERNGVTMLKNAGAYMTCTVDQFLALDPKWAKDHGNNYLALADTLKPKTRKAMKQAAAKAAGAGKADGEKEPQAGGNETAADKAAENVTVSTIAAVMDKTADVLEKIGESPKSKAQFLKIVNDAGGEPTLLAMGRLRAMLNIWWEQYPQLGERYYKLDKELEDKTGFDKEHRAA